LYSIYREHREKVISDWHHINETVTFRQNRTWIFEPTMSNGTLDDAITTLNIPAIVSLICMLRAIHILCSMNNNANDHY